MCSARNGAPGRPWPARPYFFRTTDQYEIDLVLEVGTELWAIEARLTSSPSLGDMERLNRAADLIGARRRILVSRTVQPAGSGDAVSTSLAGLIAMLA